MIFILIFRISGIYHFLQGSRTSYSTLCPHSHSSFICTRLRWALRMQSVRTVQYHDIWKDLATAEACEWHRPVAQNSRLVSRKAPTSAEKENPEMTCGRAGGRRTHHGNTRSATVSPAGKHQHGGVRKGDLEWEYFPNLKGKHCEGTHRTSLGTLEAVPGPTALPRNMTGPERTRLAAVDTSVILKPCYSKPILKPTAKAHAQPSLSTTQTNCRSMAPSEDQASPKVCAWLHWKAYLEHDRDHYNWATFSFFC